VTATIDGRGAKPPQSRKDSSFLKKSKKLLQNASGSSANAEMAALSVMNKSFLVLFFKKELLSSSAILSDKTLAG
jgi:hypothetical protein